MSILNCIVVLQLVFVDQTESIAYLISLKNGIGRKFEGIGALSGGGATSKLLPDYPKRQRNEILDLLFKTSKIQTSKSAECHVGAALQILKVEIGSDDDTTDGSEPSHMRSENEENYFRGYQWWLMKEAKKRNPDIRFQGMPWTWPHWLADKAFTSPYGNLTNTATYIANWVLGARQYHNLTIDAVGIWNEKQTNLDYIVELRRVLNEYGLESTNIVAPDHFNMDEREYNLYLQNSTLNRIVHAFTMHYPLSSFVPKNAIRSGKRLWANEDYSNFNNDKGAACLARIINRNYVHGFMTSTLVWNLITSYYNGLPYTRNGLMTAYEPWSGHYTINTPIAIAVKFRLTYKNMPQDNTPVLSGTSWKIVKGSAHHQFHQVRLVLLAGSGVGNLTGGGTYISLTDGKELTVILETMEHYVSKCNGFPLQNYTIADVQNVSFVLQGQWRRLKKLSMWQTELRFDGRKRSHVFVKQLPLKFQIESFIFDSKNRPVKEPSYLSPMIGAWEVKTEANVSFVRQVVMNSPINSVYCQKSPVAIIGDHNWTDMGVSLMMRFPFANTSSPSVFVVGLRFEGKRKSACGFGESTGIFLRIYKHSKIVALSQDFGITNAILEK